MDIKTIGNAVLGIICEIIFAILIMVSFFIIGYLSILIFSKI